MMVDLGGVISYGPSVPYFAWRPVNTRDAGWTWLRRIRRYRVYMDVYGAPGPFWEYKRYNDGGLEAVAA